MVCKFIWRVSETKRRWETCTDGRGFLPHVNGRRDEGAVCERPGLGFDGETLWTPEFGHPEESVGDGVSQGTTGV